MQSLLRANGRRRPSPVKYLSRTWYRRRISDSVLGIDTGRIPIGIVIAIPARDMQGRRLSTKMTSSKTGGPGAEEAAGGLRSPDLQFTKLPLCRAELRRRKPRGKGDRKSTRLNSSHVAISYA